MFPENQDKHPGQVKIIKVTCHETDTYFMKSLKNYISNFVCALMV